MMGVPLGLFGEASPGLSRDWDFIIDGIAGTGLRGPLRGNAREMAEALNRLTRQRGGGPGRREGGPRVVSIDIPSGNFEGWEPGMPLVEADLTLGIEPLKACLYAPAARVYGGVILRVGGIFPAPLAEARAGGELLSWEAASARIPPARGDDYKHRRGTVLIHAGSPGFTGAARIAARGAQAAGAGLIRLLVDRESYPVLAAGAGGIRVVPRDWGPERPGPGDLSPGARLLGPGWGRGPDRGAVLEAALGEEASGTPLVLDADALRLARDKSFHGNAILCPHPGEFAFLLGLSPGELPPDPVPLLRKTARERGALILYKGCVLIAAAPDGRLAALDGLEPALAAGGSGDLLAGFCAGIAARTKAAGSFDPYHAATAAAALLLESLRRGDLQRRFIDPLDLAARAAELAGAAWL
jgi:NAD(P)H-hydrate epimerase